MSAPRRRLPDAPDSGLAAGFALLLALILVLTVLVAMLAFAWGPASRDPGARVLLGAAAFVGLLALLACGALALRVFRRIRATAREHELAQVTLHSIGDGVITADAAGCVEYMNPAAERYTGWSAAAALGRPLAEVFRVVDERTGEAVVAAADGASGEGAAATWRLVGRDGRECPVRFSREPIRNRSGDEIGTITVFHDVSQLRAMAQQLAWQASHDALTGLVNRREFERRLAELAEGAKNGRRQHALLYMDLDNFKAVNDACGYAAGDELLRQLTAVMMTRMRGSDTLARLGGDEFGALLESCPLDQAMRIANALRETVRDFRFAWENRTFSVGVSIGLVPINTEYGDAAFLMSLADACCHEAKNRGRDRVQVHRPQDPALSGRSDEVRMVSQINRAFELGHFRLFRQRIVPCRPERAHECHYEVLVRMLDDKGTLMPPTAFMPAAERYNLLTSIERWIVGALAKHLHRLVEDGAGPGKEGRHPSYYVNLSGASINDRSFPDFLRGLLARYDLPHGMLCFEVTETTAIANLDRAAELMHEFKGRGCRFALDDFGTGMSSFAYLKYLPVDTLKIAGAFVKDVATDPMDCAIIEAITRIARILGMRTVAESVEDAATLEKLTALGVDFVQGYFVAEPEALTGAPQQLMLQSA